MNAADAALRRLFDELLSVNALSTEYVVFGSAVMYLHRLREDIGDVDVFVSRRVWGALFARGWRVLTPRIDDPPLLELVETSSRKAIHVFYEWTMRDAWLDVGRCFEVAETVKGFRCITLDEVAHHKREAYAGSRDASTHAKHLADLAVLEAR